MPHKAKDALHEEDTGNVWAVALRGDAPGVRRLLRHGVAPDVANAAGWRPAHAAAAGNSVAVLEVLRREAGGDLRCVLHVTDAAGRTPAFAAAQKNALDALRWLKRHGADLAARDARGAAPAALATDAATRAFLAEAAGEDLGHAAGDAGGRPAWEEKRQPGHRRRPFSGKAKKAQLQAKRADKRGDFVESEKGLEQGKGGLVSAFGERAAASGRGQGAGLHSLYVEEDRDELAARRKDAARPLGTEAVRDRAVGELPPYPLEGAAPLSAPARPALEEGDVAGVVDARESEAVGSWAALLDEQHGSELGPYERNFRVWRQLWLLYERAGAVLLVAPATAPLLHFPEPALLEAVRRGTPAILVLTKADLCPPGVADGWAAEMRRRYPALCAVVPVACDARASGGAGARARWAGSGGDGIGVLTAALCSLVPRGASRSVGELLDASAVDDAATRAWGGDPTSGADAPTTEEEEVHDDSEHEDVGTSAEEVVAEGKHAAGLRAAAAWRAARRRGDRGGAPASRDAALVGVVGEPNVGKSALINRLLGASVAGVSTTPGRTQRLQTLYVAPRLALLDCPGLVFPKCGVPRALAVLCGNLPIAQVREPYSAVRKLCEYVGLERLCAAHGVAVPRREDDGAHPSPFALMEQFAEAWHFFTPKTARPDAARAANTLLRLTLRGVPLPVCFAPPERDDGDGSLPQAADQE